jgi:solute carrier family 39 (zinc transporter), member 1/2/3
MSEAEEHHDHESSGLEYKLPTAAGLLLISFGFAYGPFWIRKFTLNKLWRSVANSTAAGIFLTASFMHIIPDCLQRWKEDPKVADVEFPWIFFIAICSFTLLLMIDRVLFGGHSHGTEEYTQSNTEKDPVKPEDNHQQSKPCCDEPACEGPIMAPSNEPAEQCALPECALDHEVEGNKEHIRQIDQNFDNNQAMKSTESKPLKSPRSPAAQTTASKSAIQPLNHKHEKPKPNLLGASSVIFSIGFHATFEGLALGLMSDFTGFLGPLLAISFHKWAESLAIGFNLVNKNLTFVQRIVAISIYSLFTPVGIIIGILAASNSNLTAAILLAITAGTFLYIGVAEIISHEFEGKQNLWIKFLCFLIGIGIMVLAWYFESLTEAHNH